MKSDIQLNSEANKLRARFGYSNREPIDIINLILSFPDYTLIKMPLSERISGMCVADEGAKYIVLNASMSPGRQHFTAAHELYHLEVEKDRAGKICHMGINDSKNESEKQADKFASYFLMPYDGLEWYCEKFKINEWDDIADIIYLSQFYQMSYMATLYRLEQEGRIDKARYKELSGKNIILEAAKLGVDLALYKKNTNEEPRIFGQYPRLLEEANTKEKISESLYAQFYREGFCKIEKDFLDGKGEFMND